MDSRAFIDESGGPDRPYFVFGGLVGATEMWSAFERAWQAELDQEPKLPALHMVKCRSKSTPWNALGDDVLHDRLSRLIAIIEKHRPQGLIGIVDTADFLRRCPAALTKDAWT